MPEAKLAKQCHVKVTQLPVFEAVGLRPGTGHGGGCKIYKLRMNHEQQNNKIVTAKTRRTTSVKRDLCHHLVETCDFFRHFWWVLPGATGGNEVMYHF